MRLLLHGSTKLGLANTACPFVAAPRPQKALLHLCSASAVPFTTRASLAPLLAHPLQTFVFLAGTTAGEQSRALPKSQAVATTSLALGTLGTVALMVFLGALPSEPSSLIAVTGHVLGNAMIMVGRTLKALQHEIAQHTGQIEAALALGATPYCSIQSYVRQAFVHGMAPMVDAVKVMGLVSLPGNMTGLLMGGAGPLEAVKTQIKLMNAVLGAAAISCLIATLLGWHMLFTSQSQLQEGGSV
eukprot:c22834_g1_i4 orf=192-920(+)